MKLKTFRNVPADVEYRDPGDGSGRSRRLPGGSGGGGPNPTALPPSEAGQVVVSPPTVERPPSASDFNLFATLAARNAGNTPAAFPAGAVFPVPAGNVAVIRSLSILANGLLVTSNIVWRLFFNGVPVTGWDNLTINPRAAASVELTWGPEETFIPVPEGATISFDVTVNDAGTYQVSVSAHGWFYPATMATQFAGAYGG